MHALELFTLPLSDPLLIFLILIASVLFVPMLARRLGFPDIMGLIVVGILLGPNVLGVLARDRVVELFGSVGIMFLMFIAGLEIDANDFRRYQGKSIIFGALTFCIPMLLGTGAGLWLLGMDIMAAVLLASMFASHTLLTYPLASKLKITGDEAVGVAVGGTIITDVAALLVLAVIAAMKQGEFGPGLAIRMSLSLAAFTAFELFLLPKLAGFVYHRLEKDGDFQFLFTLGVLFFSGVLGELAGVEPIIGAFLAGIAVGRHITPISPLANRLEFFGNAIFVPAFLLSVGMLVDPRAFVADARSIVVSAVMSVCVVVAKFAAAQLSRLLFKWKPYRGTVMFGLSVPQAAATLAAVLVGYNLGIFDDSVLNGTIVMILVSVLVGSAAVQAAGPRIARAREIEEPQPAERRILFGAVNPETAPRLLELALALKGEGAVKALTVLPVKATDRRNVLDATRLLDALAEKAAAASFGIDRAYRSDSSPVRGLANGASEYMASDVLIGWKRRKALFGNGGEAVVRELLASVDARVVAAKLEGPMGTIERVEAVFMDGALSASDFDACVTMLKRFVKAAKANLSCVGSDKALRVVEACMASSPALSGVAYRRAEAHKALARPPAWNERGVMVVVAPRPDASAWRDEGGRAIADADTRLKDREFIFLFPRVPEEPEQGRTKRFGSALRGFFGKVVQRARKPG